MAITFGSFCSAIQRSLSAQVRAEREERAFQDEKRRQIEAQEAAWRLEIKAREIAALDAPARKAAERRAIQEQRDQERRDFEAACIGRFMDRHS